MATNHIKRYQHQVNIIFERWEYPDGTCYTKNVQVLYSDPDTPSIYLNPIMKILGKLIDALAVWRFKDKYFRKRLKMVTDFVHYYRAELFDPNEHKKI